jgi:hypothetical protein
MKSFRKLTQINQFKKFFIFCVEFQRLTSNVELYDKKILIENLKNRMSFELQKVMINNHLMSSNCMHSLENVNTLIKCLET